MKKATLRNIYKSKREEISNNDLKDRSNKINELIQNNISLTDKTISIFLPISKQNEIDTFKLLKNLSKENKIGISKSNFESYTMKHYVFENENLLQENKFGIPEPIKGVEIDPKEFDVVFIPLFTIDKFGYRVGFGKGFYDRFLSKCNSNCIFIGLHLFENIDEIDDVNEYDIKLDLCITPTKIIEFNSSKKSSILKLR